MNVKNLKKNLVIVFGKSYHFCNHDDFDASSTDIFTIVSSSEYFSACSIVTNILNQKDSKSMQNLQSST